MMVSITNICSLVDTSLLPFLFLSLLYKVHSHLQRIYTRMCFYSIVRFDVKSLCVLIGHVRGKCKYNEIKSEFQIDSSIGHMVMYMILFRGFSLMLFVIEVRFVWKLIVNHYNFLVNIHFVNPAWKESLKIVGVDVIIDYPFFFSMNFSSFRSCLSWLLSSSIWRY